MKYQPGAICTGMSEDYFSWKSTGDGDPYMERLRSLITCTEYGVEFTSRFMTSH